MTAKETLDMFRARGQLTVSLIGLAIFFVVVITFTLVMHRVPDDQRLTIAVMLLSPLASLVTLAGSFWLSRARDDGAEKPPTVSSSSTPGGGTSVSIVPAGAPVVVPAAADPVIAPASAAGAVVASAAPVDPGDTAAPASLKENVK